MLRGSPGLGYQCQIRVGPDAKCAGCQVISAFINSSGRMAKETSSSQLLEQGEDRPHMRLQGPKQGGFWYQWPNDPTPTLISFSPAFCLAGLTPNQAVPHVHTKELLQFQDSRPKTTLPRKESLICSNCLHRESQGAPQVRCPPFSPHMGQGRRCARFTGEGCDMWVLGTYSDLCHPKGHM